MIVVSISHRRHRNDVSINMFEKFPVGPGGFDLSQTGTVGGVPSENKAEVSIHIYIKRVCRTRIELRIFTIRYREFVQF